MNNNQTLSKTKSPVRRILTTLIIVALCLITCFMATACDDGSTSTDTSVKMSVLYTDNQTYMRYGTKRIPYKPFSNIAGAEDYGKTYVTNDFKPAWEELQNRLDITIKDATPTSASSVSDAFDKLQAMNFKTANILSGPVTGIVDQGTQKGAFVNLGNYLDRLPNLKKFLEDTEIAKISATSGDGAIYYAPYCDGFDDVETMFICRIDWVKTLLDEDSVFDTTLNKLSKTVYQPYYTSMDTTFEVADADEADHTRTVTVKYDGTVTKGAIARQNAISSTELTGAKLVEQLRAYIDEVYMTPANGFAKRSDIFVGQDACYNADDLVALWRCVKANPLLLTGDRNSNIVPYYPRANTADRTNAIIQLAQIWGVRGYDSRNGYFYVDENGELKDSRTTDDRMESLEFLNQLYQEGLILNNYEGSISGENADFRTQLNEGNLGFMTYDYNQTTTIFNTTAKEKVPESFNLSPVLFPVADWDNKATASANGGYTVTGANTLYQYTESWRSIKTEGWAITSATTKNEAVFDKCLKLIDYMYSTEGQILMSYGPDAYIQHDANGDVVYIDYYDRKVPQISDNAKKELVDINIGGSNYTNYYRYYVGATLPIGYVKEQGMEFQTVDEKGAIGLEYIMNAVSWGVLKHASVERSTAAPQNSLVPSTFALTKSESANIADNCQNLSRAFSNTQANGKNIFHDYILYGFETDNTTAISAGRGTLSKEGLKSYINNELKCTQYLQIHSDSYKRMYGIQ